MTDNAAPTLVIMAAGLGSRFGGVKQLAVVGDAGESIMDFSIRHAIEAGFADVVLIVRSDIEDDVRAHVANVHGDDVTVRYVRQDDLGPGRAKPWGCHPTAATPLLRRCSKPKPRGPTVLTQWPS